MGYIALQFATCKTRPASTLSAAPAGVREALRVATYLGSGPSLMYAVSAVPTFDEALSGTAG